MPPSILQTNRNGKKETRSVTCLLLLLTGPGSRRGRWVREKHDFLSLPLLVRPTSIIAVGSQDSRPNSGYSDGVILQVYDLADGVAVWTTILFRLKGCHDGECRAKISGMSKRPLPGKGQGSLFMCFLEGRKL